MKKLAKLTFIFVAIFCIALSGKAYAASLDCNIEIQTPKTEYTKGEEFVANVYVSGIKSEKGILALSAFLDYDKDSLTLLEMNGKNSWDTPTKDVSYNEANGKMALLRNSLGKDDEVIFEMKFKVKEDSDASASIALKNVTAANGLDTPKSLNTINKDLVIKAASTNPPSSDEDDNKGDKPGDNNGNNNDNNNGNNNSGNNNNNNNGGNHNNNNGNGNSGNNGSNNNGKNTNTNTNSNTNTNKTARNTNTNAISNTNVADKATGTIPKTGIASHPVFIIILVVVIIAGLYFYGRMTYIDRKTRK